MLPTKALLKRQLRRHIDDKARQGYETGGLPDALDRVADSYDALCEFAHRLAHLPTRTDWPHVEPLSLEDIRAESDPDRPTGRIAAIDPEAAAGRAESAFLGSVCGCVLGKPLEINPTLAQLETMFGAIGEWPISDYVSEKVRAHVKTAMGDRDDLHPSWTECCRERLRHVAIDDDINYTIVGMLMLESHGVGFTRQDLMSTWLHQLPPLLTFGPERMMMIRGTLASYEPGDALPFDVWTTEINPGEERCGAVIRADAYGYACPGMPELASELAWRDATLSHTRTGVYGSMFVAAMIACAAVMEDRLEIARTALRFVPRASRFYKITADCLRKVESSSDWRSAYDLIHAKYGEYGHCMIYQEIGTLINTLRFARDIGDGICIQVMQGCDTDSFGATAGSILGACFGPGHLDPRWLEPFNDDMRTGLAQFHAPSVRGLAERMGRLPGLVEGQLTEGGPASRHGRTVNPGAAEDGV